MEQAPLALSTVWAQIKRPLDSPAPQPAEVASGILERIDDSGIRNLELEYRLRREVLDIILPELAQRGIGIVSLHNYIPTPPGMATGSGDAFNLAHLDKEERALAVKHAAISMELASDLEVEALVLHLGQITDMLDKKITPAAARQGQLTPEMTEHLALRAGMAARHVDAASFSLERLLPRAEKLGVSLALENRNHASELPNAAEAALLFERFEGARLGAWYDTGHAYTQALAGVAPVNEWVHLFRDKLLGAHLHDSVGPDDHMPPGMGDQDWPEILRLLEGCPRMVLEVRPMYEAGQIRDAVAMLEDVRAGLGEY